MNAIPMRGRGRPMTRLGGAPSTTTTSGTGFPWLDGDMLYAADLNAGTPTAGTGLNVVAYGAKLDGVTDDSAAFTAAYNAAADRGTVYVPPGDVNIPGGPVGAAAICNGTKRVLWNFSGNFFSVGAPIDTIGNGVVESVFGNYTKFFGRGSTIGNDHLGGVVRVDMHLDHADGVSGGVAALDVNAYTSAASTLNAAPIGISGRLTMSSTQSGGAVGVGIFGSASKHLGAGNASPFGGNLLADDQTGLSSVNGGSAVGAEIDLKANKLDDGVSADGFNVPLTGTYPGSNRVVLALQYGRSNRSDNTPMEVSTILQMGLFSTTIDGAYCSAKNAIKVQGSISFAGLNFLHSTFNAGAQAIALQTEQTIGWTTDATSVVPTHWNCLQYRAATNRLYYTVNGVDRWSVDASGNMRCSGTVTGSTTP